MNDVYFVKTRYQDNGYTSYTDYFDMVALAGFPVVYVDEIQPDSDNTYIITPLNGEWLGGWQNPRARIILWDLEWRLDWHATQAPPGVSEVWASDKAYAAHIGAKYVLMGSDARLATRFSPLERVTPLYDIVTLQYMTPRRDRVVSRLREGKYTIAPNGWGAERDAILRQSRLMLHVHQLDNAPYNAFLRLAVAAAYAKPVISEMVASPAPYVQGGNTYTVLYSDYADLLHAVHFGLDNLSYLGEWLHQFLCVDNPFRKCVEGML